MARGITGFTIDVMSGKEASDSNSHLHMLLAAAQAVDPRFKIVVMPDISALKADATSVTQITAAAAASPLPPTDCRMAAWPSPSLQRRTESAPTGGAPCSRN